MRNYAISMAKANGVFTAQQFFTISPPRETLLRDALIENADPFMGKITVMLVEQLVGQVVSTGIPGLYTGRKKDGRFNKALGSEGNEYKLYEVDSGSFLDYTTLTNWANAGTENEFYNRLQAFFYKSVTNDLLRVALNGTHAADETNPDTCPNGEDIHPGWHQIVKARTPKQIITDKVVLNRTGTGADFTSVDAIAADVINTCIPPEFRQHPDLVVLVSQNIIAADTVSMLNRIDRPTEKSPPSLSTVRSPDASHSVRHLCRITAWLSPRSGICICTSSAEHSNAVPNGLMTANASKTTGCVCRVAPWNMTHSTVRLTTLNWQDCHHLNMRNQTRQRNGLTYADSGAKVQSQTGRAAGNGTPRGTDRTRQSSSATGATGNRLQGCEQLRHQRRSCGIQA